MSPDEIRSAYRRDMDAVGETIAIRRYTGAGANRPWFDVEVMARVVDFEPHELVGTIVQGDRKLIVLAEDIGSTGLALPVTTDDRVVVRGKEMRIVSADDSTRRVQGTLIAYEFQARG